MSTVAIFSVLKQVICASKYVPDEGYIYQDVKPFNILLNSTGRAVLGDFGVGHSFHSIGMAVGTPAYQAPEAFDASSASEEEWAEIPRRRTFGPSA
jgi:serine/threonine protein kinase